MKTTGILLVGYNSTIDAKIAAEVARMAFPRAVVKSIGTLDEAIASPPIAEVDLLVLMRATPDAVERAMNVVDDTELPRWAIVVVGTHPVPLGIQTIQPAEWAGPVTSHAFHSAIAQHALRRELARTKSDLAVVGTRIAHDLRTQVASILATAELSKEVLQEVEPIKSELYQPIFDSVDTLGKLIERVSFVTKATAKGAAKTACKMKEAVNGAVSRLASEIVEKKASLVQPTEWPEITASRQYLEKIWFNLITNALIHSGDSPRIELGWRKEKNEHRFWVRDRGQGVAADSRAHLFRPFHQMHHSSSPRGLGLPIVHRLSELHGGRCGYESPRDGGSEFFFTVPI
jgi:signal transduction histidine kinase